LTTDRRQCRKDETGARIERGERTEIRKREEIRITRMAAWRRCEVRREARGGRRHPRTGRR